MILSIRDVIDSINNVARGLFADFDEVREIHAEARRIHGLYSDGLDDRLALAQLDSTMIQISTVFLKFSDNHLRTVLQLKRLELILTTASVEENDRNPALCGAYGVTQDYLDYQAALGSVMRSFKQSASRFLFPSRETT